jgi:OFA family oxalate/formate antiporter-like MFS transporter
MALPEVGAGFGGPVCDPASAVLIEHWLFALTNVETMGVDHLFFFLFSVGFGGSVPLMPAIRAEYFGIAALGKIQGFMNPVMMLAGAVGPIFAGYVFDTTGSYRISFMVTGLLTFCAVGAIFLARPARPNQASG